MAKAKILKTPDPKPQPPPKKDRPHRPCFTPEEWEKGIPISREEFQRLQEAWYAIGDLASLLKETSSDGPTNPCYVLQTLTNELGEALAEVKAKFEKAEGGAA